MSSSLRLIPTALLLFASIASLAFATCYEPNGAIIQDDTSCDSTAEASYCCGTGWSCLSDGICTIGNGNTTSYYRGSCTDKSWDSQECPNFCLQYGTNSSIPMGKCERTDGQDWYCCPGDDSCDCDTGVNAVKLGGSQPTTVTVVGSTSWPGIGQTSSTPASTASTTGSALTSKASFVSTKPTSSPTSSSSTSAAPSASSTGTSSHTAVAAGVGAGVGGAAAIGAAGVIFYFLRRRRAHDPKDIKSVEHRAEGSNGGSRKGMVNSCASEIDSTDTTVHEATDTSIHEAPATNMVLAQSPYAAQQDKNHSNHLHSNYGMAPVELDASTYEASELDAASSVYSPQMTSPAISPMTPDTAKSPNDGIAHRLA